MYGLERFFSDLVRYWCFDQIWIYFSKYLGHVDLDVSTDADESHTRQEKDEVEQKDNVLDENVTTIHLGRL